MTHDSAGMTAGKRVRPARDLAAQSQEHAGVRETFVRHALARLPLIGVFVITINLFVQVRGDVGLAVSVAQNLTFGALAVIVLLNLVVFIMLGVMVAAMPLVFDPDYNLWTRIVGSAVLVLLGIVMAFTTPWLLIVALLVVFIITGVIVMLGRRKPHALLNRQNIESVLRSSDVPLDTELRSLWIQGRAMLRAVSSTAPPVTPLEATLHPSSEPKTLATVAEEWNARSALIQEPRAKSLTRLAFAGIIGFIALFGISVVTQPIRFAPLELVTLKGEEPAVGFVLLQTTRGVFIPDPFGTVQFITADQITSRALCEDTPHWWSASIIQVLRPATLSGVECPRGP